jgi:hypothetical protein
MAKEILIYGLAKESTQDWQEDLLACFPDTVNTQSNIAKVIEAASAQGFHSFRVTNYNGEMPNFAKALNI